MKHSTTIVVANNGDKEVSINTFEPGVYRRIDRENSFILIIDEDKRPMLMTPTYSAYISLDFIFERKFWEKVEDGKKEEEEWQ